MKVYSLTQSSCPLLHLQKLHNGNFCRTFLDKPMYVRTVVIATYHVITIVLCFENFLRRNVCFHIKNLRAFLYLNFVFFHCCYGSLCLLNEIIKILERKSKKWPTHYD